MTNQTPEQMGVMTRFTEILRGTRAGGAIIALGGSLALLGSPSDADGAINGTIQQHAPACSQGENEPATAVFDVDIDEAPLTDDDRVRVYTGDPLGSDYTPLVDIPITNLYNATTDDDTVGSPDTNVSFVGTISGGVALGQATISFRAPEGVEITEDDIITAAVVGTKLEDGSLVDQGTGIAAPNCLVTSQEPEPEPEQPTEDPVTPPSTEEPIVLPKQNVSPELRCGGLIATIVGTPGNDVINGTPGRDVIRGLGGNDVIRGLGGNDVICGDNGADTLIGGNGGDKLFGGAGSDRMKGGNGNDLLRGGNGRDTLDGQSGHDSIWGGLGNDILFGRTGNDRLNGDQGADRIFGHSGSDRASGGNGPDKIFGGPGRDRLNGGNGNDVLHGQTGKDVLNGQNGNDFLTTGTGERRGYDIAKGGLGKDLIQGGKNSVRLLGGKGRDTIATGIAIKGSKKWVSTGPGQKLRRVKPGTYRG